MEFLKRHWLGIVVVLSLGYAWFGMATMPARLVPFFCMPFTLFFVIWCIRGFFRMAGRAWQHGAQTAKRTAR